MSSPRLRTLTCGQLLCVMLAVIALAFTPARATTWGEGSPGERPSFRLHAALGTDAWELVWGSRTDWAQQLTYRDVAAQRDTWLIYEHTILEDVRDGPGYLPLTRQAGWRATLRQRLVQVMASINVPTNTRGFGVLDVEFLPTQWPERSFAWDPNPVVPGYLVNQVNAWKQYVQATYPEQINGKTEAEKQVVYRTTWEAAVRDLFLMCLEECKALRPMLKWGYYGYPNTLLHGENGEPNNLRRQLNDELQWLWDASDAIFPCLYNQFVAVAWDAPLTNPAMRHPWFIERFYRSNMQEARLRAGREKPVLAFIGTHYFDFMPAPYTNTFMQQQDVANSFFLPKRYNADGVILWGVVANQQNFVEFQNHLDTLVLPAARATLTPVRPPTAVPVQDAHRPSYNVYWEVATEAAELYQRGNDWAGLLDLRGTPIRRNFAMIYESDLPSVVDIRTQGLQIAQNPAFETRMRSDMRAAVAWATRDIPSDAANTLGCIDIEHIYADWSNWTGGPGIYPTFNEARPMTTAWANYIMTQRPQLIAGLSVAAREEVFRQTYEQAFARMFIVYIEEAKLARPDIKWGFYGFPVSGGPVFWEKQRAGTLAQYNDAKRWLWDISDVLYPSMYQLWWAAAPGVMPAAGEVSAWDNKWWNQLTIREARRLAGPDKLVIPFEGFRFFEFVPERIGQFISDTNLRDSIELPRETGADGVVIWDMISSDLDRAHYQWFMDRRALPMIARTIFNPPLPVIQSRSMGVAPTPPSAAPPSQPPAARVQPGAPAAPASERTNRRLRGDERRRGVNATNPR